MADENTARMKAEEYRVRTVEISKLGKNIDKLRECYHSMKNFLVAAIMADFILRILLRVRPAIFGPFVSDDSLTIARANMVLVYQKFKLHLRAVEMNYRELKEKQDKGFDNIFAYQFWWYIYRKTTTDLKVFPEIRDNFIFEILKDKTESIFETSVYLKMENQIQKLIDNFKATEQHLDWTIRSYVIKSNHAVYEDDLLILKSAFEKYKGFYRLLFPESLGSEIKMKKRAEFALYFIPVEAKLKYYNLLHECQEECLSEANRLMDQLNN